ncbi:MAG: sulfatase [Anaerolineae bacterium]|nr:sulfatase [Anaerolineae bacterium]
MNIILCIIDTLRYDYIHAAGINSWIKTPNIDRLARKSLMFDRAFTASYPTIPHRTDVITGDYAWEGHGPFHPWMPLRFNTPTLPRILAQAGYATQLIHDTPHLVNGGHAFDWPFSAWTFIRGAEVDRPWIDDKGLTWLANWKRDPIFDYIDDAELTGATRRLLLTYTRTHRLRSNPEDWNVARLFTRAADFLMDNRNRKNFFLWLDCFDPHEPWDSPPDYVKTYDNTPGYDGFIDPRAFSPKARRPKDGELPPGVHQRQLALYAAKVSWMDHWFGRVLDTLDATGLMENTAIVFTADHGTNLGERGGFGKTGIVNEQEAHVPLLVYAPDLEPGRNNSFIQPQDIFTTVLGLAGINHADPSPGSDIIANQGTSRSLAIGGPSINSWQGDPRQIVMTLFDEGWYLNIAADPAACRLYQYGAVENMASENMGIVMQLRDKAWHELSQRATHPAVIDWLRSGGATQFRDAWSAWIGPENWTTYWERVYEE